MYILKSINQALIRLRISSALLSTRLILWDEKVTDIFVSLINTLSLSFSETEIRNSMAKLSENENFGRLFAYGFGAHHLWVAQRMITDPEKVMENRLLIVEF